MEAAILTRYPDWPERLAAFLARPRRFSWAHNNCALFLCNAVREITGTDLAAEFRRRCKSKASTMEVLNERGGLESIAAAVAEKYQMTELPIMRAQRGDAVLLREPRPTLGVIGMNGKPMFAGGKSFPVQACARAWRVG